MISFKLILIEGQWIYCEILRNQRAV